MRRSLQLATVLLTASLGASTLFAQGQSHQKGGAQNSGSHASRGTATNGRGTGSSIVAQHGHRTLSTVPSPGYVSPFQQQIHLPGGGGGCYNCGYTTYGGYVYSGYEGTYNPVGPTTTDRILANGGTFNNINNTPDSQPQSTPQQPQQPQPMYIRPEYPTQYSADNGTVNSSLPSNMASASSDSPAILIFKDGTNLTIHNYAIYGTNIVVLTPERQKFPIAAIDIPATEKANEAAGYELKLPAVFTSH